MQQVNRPAYSQQKLKILTVAMGHIYTFWYLWFVNQICKFDKQKTIGEEFKIKAVDKDKVLFLSSNFELTKPFWQS